jgi:hypothetical protein
MVTSAPHRPAPVRPAPTFEPSTDFPALDLVPTIPGPEPPRRWIPLVLVVAGALLVGSIGFALGRSTAGIPAACERVTQLADRAATVAVADLRTVREGMMVFLDGEIPEAYSILGDARLGVDELRTLQAQLDVATRACLAG